MKILRKTDRQLSSVISRIGHRDEGFSMISATMALMVGTLLSLAAWATANSDINFTDKDKWGRLAYQRAQSGVSDYVQHLAEDSGFWKSCDRPDGVTGDGLGQTALNDNDFGASNHPQRRWLPWSTAGTPTDLSYNAQYTIDLQPRTGSCKPSDTAANRIIDPEHGTFRVSVTGRAGPLAPSNLTGSQIEQWRQKNWKRVTIVAEFRKNGFLDYGYFTDHEGLDPLLQATALQTACDAYYQDDPGYNASNPRSASNIPGRWRQNASGGSDCSEIQFADGDKLAGPFHTNDSLKLGSAPNSGSSTLFGNANKNDAIEIYDNGKGNCPVRTTDVSLSNSSTTPSNCYTCPVTPGATDSGDRTCPTTNMDNSVVRLNSTAKLRVGTNAKYIDLPETNSDLITYADPYSGDTNSQGYSFYGKTSITINANNTLTVSNNLINGGSATTYNFPSSGVVYVFNYGVSACQSSPYTQSYANSIPTGCAVAEVKGTYNKSLTIGSAADIVITGDIKRGTSLTAVLGLISSQYVRIRHYPKNSSDKNYANSSGNCSYDGVGTGTAPVNTVQAAILTLQKSFTVDGYQCGAHLGTMNFTGALAQRWRGTVGTGSSSGCTGGTGYCKNYAYDYQFKSQTPPHFLSPSAASWKIIRQRQTVPACLCKSTG